MSTTQVVAANSTALILLLIAYRHSGWRNIAKCYGMWFTKNYWTNYNIIEILSWTTKAIIIIPGLIFGIKIWWLYFFTLSSSLALIWVSNKKLLPTLVWFNTIWAWISCMVLAQHLIG